MPTELEMKLHIPNDTVAEQIFSDPMVAEYISTDIKLTEMTSMYYDTPAGALSNLRWSLRLRKEGDVSVASLKTSSVDITGYFFSRNEWQSVSPTIKAGIPLLVEQGAPEQILDIISGTHLVESCQIKFTRKHAILKLPEGVLVEIAIDKGTIYAGGKEAPLYEIELELLFGEPDALAPLSDLFTNKYKLNREILSKYEKALRLIRSR